MNNQCVQCGYCCTKGTCSYGLWNRRHNRCVFLTADLQCAMYNEIVELERDSRYPMFGCGCSSSLCNSVRDAKTKEKQNA